MYENSPPTLNIVSHPFADATSFWTQLWIVLQRNSVALWRSPEYVFSRLVVHGVLSLCTSLTFLRLGNSSRDLQYRVFGMFVLSLPGCVTPCARANVNTRFQTIVLPAILMSQAEPRYINNRRVFSRGVLHSVPPVPEHILIFGRVFQ